MNGIAVSDTLDGTHFFEVPYTAIKWE